MTLPYFNPKSATTLQTDASKKGLGAVILQDSRPVMFASWALTGAEKNYQNLERECLAMIWGMEKFHYFLYGKQFTLKTDQKPLVSIYKKHMVEISPRIQRLIVRSFPYQPFDVHYRRGKEIPLADALSRVSPTPVEEDGIQLPIVAVNLITSNIPVSSTEIELIHEESSKDPTLTLLRHYIHMGWPIDHRILPQELHTFWNYRVDLSMENGLITKGARLIIPSTLRRKVLEQIHEGHLGIEKCMLKARDSVFWPGISNNTSTGAMDLDPGQPVFVKEVNGNICRTATVNQPVAEPHSYWVRFPDNSILRRTRSMIKPRSLPSHFELQAEAQQRNFEGETNSHSCESFNQLNGQSMLPVIPMVSVTNPATVDRGSKVSETPNPINSTEAPQPSGGATPSLPPTPRCSTRSTKGVPPVCYTPSKK